MAWLEKRINLFRNPTDEWDDARWSWALAGILTLTCFFGLMWVLMNTAGITLQESNVVIFYLILIVGGAFVGMGDHILERIGLKRDWLVGFAEFGDSLKQFGLALAVGIVFSLLVTLPASFASITILPFSIGSSTFLFTVLVAPYVEEKVWASWIPFQFRAILDNYLPKAISSALTITIVCITFAVFHYLAYGMVLSAVLPVVFIRLIWMLGNSWFESCGFSIGAHYAWNFMKYVQKYGMVMV